MQKLEAYKKGIQLYQEFVDQGNQDVIWVNTDEQRMMQVLFSLQSNAIKYTKKGEVKHIVEIIEKLDDKYLKISVQDTGLGIKEEDRDKLFKLYGQIKNNKGLN